LEIIMRIKIFNLSDKNIRGWGKDGRCFLLAFLLYLRNFGYHLWNFFFEFNFLFMYFIVVLWQQNDICIPEHTHINSKV
jgi:hypothetical protein